jgi:metal-responsive CopG/Arc/MetJ family transcriptional regulator
LTAVVKISIALPVDLIEFADREANRRGTDRSALIAELLLAERIRVRTKRYLDRHGWDIAEDAMAWRKLQRRRMAREYARDEW